MTGPTAPVGVSAGTASVLGLRYIRQTDAPSTAYLMLGDRCSYDCAFCAQGRSSAARSHFLSRIAWPPYPTEQVLAAVARSFAQRRIVRCCLQVTVSPGFFRRTLAVLQQLHSLSTVPICASIVVSDFDSIHALLECGAERVTLALDAACERVNRAAKGGDWRARLRLLKTAADRFPGRIGTHVIVGLGETEQEMAALLQEAVDCYISVGLFSFTPIPGTLWGRRSPPSLVSYRRIQTANYLLRKGHCRVGGFRFDADGHIVSYGLGEKRLSELLADGRAFETAGCPGCNRPYYNERPGKLLYNYPRSLNREEAETAVTSVLDGLMCGKVLPVVS